MSRPTILLEEELNGDRPLQLVRSGEKGDATETPVPDGERRPDITEPSPLGGRRPLTLAPPAGVRTPRAANLVPPSSDEATGGLDQHLRGVHERDGITAADDGKVDGSLRKLGSLYVFAPPHTFVIEARYLLTRSGCSSKMEVPSWWRFGLLVSLSGYCLLCEGNPWGLFFLHAGADILIANWNARSEAHDILVGSRCSSKMEVSDVTPALAAESQRVGAPPPAVEASLAEWTPSPATGTPCIEPRASVLAVEAPSIDECAPVPAFDAPRVDPGHGGVFMPPSRRTRRLHFFRARYVSRRLRRVHVVTRWASMPITNEFVEAVVARLRAEGLAPSASKETRAPAIRRGTRSRAAVPPPSPALASSGTAAPASPPSGVGDAQAPKIAPSGWYDQDSSPIARRTYLELCRERKIENCPVGKKILVQREVLDAWILTHRKSPPPPPPPPAPTNEELLRGAGVVVPPSARRTARSSTDPPTVAARRTRRRSK